MRPPGDSVFRAFHDRAHASVLFDAGMDAFLGFLAVLVAAWWLSAAPLTEIYRPLADPSLRLVAVGFALGMAALLASMGLYRQVGLSLPAQILRLLVAAAMGGYLTYLLLKEVHFDGEPGRLIGHSVLNLLAALIVVRGALALARHAVGQRRFLIVGTGAEAVSVAHDLRHSPRMRGELVGFYPAKDAATDAEIDPALVLDRNIELERLVSELEIDSIIVATREQRGGAMPMEQLVVCRSKGVPVLDLAGFYEQTHGEVPLDSLKASWLIYGPGFVQGQARQVLKRAFDVLTSSFLLLLASPVMILAARASSAAAQSWANPAGSASAASRRLTTSTRVPGSRLAVTSTVSPNRSRSCGRSSPSSGFIEPIRTNRAGWLTDTESRSTWLRPIADASSSTSTRWSASRLTSST